MTTLSYWVWQHSSEYDNIVEFQQVAYRLPRLVLAVAFIITTVWDSEIGNSTPWPFWFAPSQSLDWHTQIYVAARSIIIFSGILSESVVILCWQFLAFDRLPLTAWPWFFQKMNKKWRYVCKLKTKKNNLHIIYSSKNYIFKIWTNVLQVLQMWAIASHRHQRKQEEAWPSHRRNGSLLPVLWKK